MASPPISQAPIDSKTSKFVLPWVGWLTGLVESASGTMDQVKLSRTAATITSGAYDPEGTETAVGGSMFLRTDTFRLYVKQSASGNTGWSLK